MNTLAHEKLGLAIVDDDSLYLDMLRSSVSKLTNFEIYEATSGAELERVLGSQKIDCIAMDFDLGLESGLLVKERIDTSFPDHAPAILLTGTGSEITAVRAFRMGMADYLSKRLTSPTIFVETVLKTVDRERKRLSAKAEFRKLTEEATLDGITGLEGRARLDERLTQLALLPPTSRSAYAVIVVELQEYQAILDGFGLKTADKALRAFADKLHYLVRSHDVVGRYCSNLFFAIANLSGDDESLQRLCLRLERNLASPVKLDAGEITLTANVKGQFCSPCAKDGLLGDPRLPPRLQKFLQSQSFLQAIESDLSPTASPFESADGDAPPAVAIPSRALNPATANAVPAADALRGAERRESIRHRVFKRGLIRTLDPSGVVHCNIRNISEGGAGLRVDVPFAAPDLFDLEILGSGERRPVQRRWMTGCDLGVQFLTAKNI